MGLVIETSRTSCFVSPDLCKHLTDAGLTSESTYHWRIYNGIAKIWTYAFDPDDYYRDGHKLQNYASSSCIVLPAFSIKDVERVLPSGFLLTLTENGYEASLNDIYAGDSCTADRMPDVFAKLLLQSIQKRYVDLKKVNLILSK